MAPLQMYRSGRGPAIILCNFLAGLAQKEQTARPCGLAAAMAPASSPAVLARASHALARLACRPGQPGGCGAPDQMLAREGLVRAVAPCG